MRKMVLNKYIDRWLLSIILLLGLLVGLGGGLLVHAGQLQLVRLFIGLALISGAFLGSVGHWKMISSGPYVRLLTLMYMLKETAIALVGASMIFRIIKDVHFENDVSSGVSISYALIVIASFFIFGAGFYTYLGTVFNIFKLEVRKFPFPKNRKH